MCSLMEEQFKKETRGINENVPLPARELLAAIIAVWPFTVGRFHRLAINDAR